MTIVNGIDLGHFDPSREPLDLARFGVPADALVVAVIGSLTEQKDHENFVEAAATLAARDPRVCFLIVGAGPLRDGIAASIDALGDLQKRIILTGEISQMPQLLAAIDVLAISSRWEGLPMVLLEGMAMRRGIVATAVGGIPDVVEDGVNGRLVTAADPQALAKAIADLLNDETARARLGKAARETIARSFDSTPMRRRVCEVYDTLSAPEPNLRGASEVRLPTL
jgi:glycosyltransferase involved in cell wall biosynthesis